MDKVRDEQYDIYEILKEWSKAIEALLEDTPITDTLLKMPEVIENTLENVRLRIENKGKLMGVSTGIEALDHLIGGWLPGQSGVVGGRPGSGKTAFMLHLLKCFI